MKVKKLGNSKSWNAPTITLTIASNCQNTATILDSAPNKRTDPFKGIWDRGKSDISDSKLFF